MLGLSPVAIKAWPKSVFKKKIKIPVITITTTIPKTTLLKYWGKLSKNSLLSNVFLPISEILEPPIILKLIE